MGEGPLPTKKLLSHLPPKAVLEMMPRPTELVAAHRRFLYGTVGCGVVAVGILLGLLFVPWWAIVAEAKDTVKKHLDRVQQRDFAGAAEFCAPDMLPPPIFAAKVRTVADRLAGGSFAVRDLHNENGRTYVSVAITTADDRVMRLRYWVWYDDDGELKIADFAFDTPISPPPLPHVPPPSTHPQG